MSYHRNCPITIGNSMIVTDPGEWKQKVRNYIINNAEDFFLIYQEEAQNGCFRGSMTFTQWVDYYLEHMVFTETIIVDNYRKIPIDN